MNHVIILLSLFLGLVLSKRSPSQLAIDLTELSLNADHKVLQVENSDFSFVFGNSEFTHERDFWTLLTITSTLPAHGCNPCEDLQKVLGRVANSYFADYADYNVLYFVNLDLVHQSNLQVIQDLGLNTIPHIWLLPPNKAGSGVNEDFDDDDDEEEVDESQRQAASQKLNKTPFKLAAEPRFNFQLPDTGSDDQALALANFVAQNLQKSIVLRQEDPISSFLKVFGLTLGGLLFLKKRGPKVITNLGKVTAYKFICIGMILAFVCGYSFTTIERVPFLARNDQGGLIYISGGQTYQFGIEILVVGSNYLALALGLVSMTYFGAYRVSKDSVIDSEATKAVIVLFHAAAIYFLYSVLTSIVLRKDGDYPYYFSKLF